MTPRGDLLVVQTLADHDAGPDHLLTAADRAQETAERLDSLGFPWLRPWLAGEYRRQAREWRRAAATLRTIAPLTAVPPARPHGTQDDLRAAITHINELLSRPALDRGAWVRVFSRRTRL